MTMLRVFLMLAVIIGSPSIAFSQTSGAAASEHVEVALHVRNRSNVSIASDVSFTDQNNARQTLRAEGPITFRCRRYTEIEIQPISRALFFSKRVRCPSQEHAELDGFIDAQARLTSIIRAENLDTLVAQLRDVQGTLRLRVQIEVARSEDNTELFLDAFLSFNQLELAPVFRFNPAASFDAPRIPNEDVNRATRVAQAFVDAARDADFGVTRSPLAIYQVLLQRALRRDVVP